MTIKAKKSKINLREKLAELLNFRQIRDRLDGLGLYLGKDRTGTTENVAVRGGANVDDLQLAEISAALGGTAVDVFVYDTRNDSDGGKWRERTSHTSWYNEELNTATRGSRREFPAVAVIVAEAGKVTIYDGDDPDLSMWMVFEGTYLGLTIANILTSDDTHPLSSVFALQGILCIGVSALNGFEYINFVDDSAGYYRASNRGVYNGGILERNDGKGKIFNSGSFLVDDTVNDVAMTVLPNAPIDADTGLPIPTVAVATDGGVSVIKDDGSSVVGYTCTYSSNNKYSLINFIEGSKLLACSRDGGTYPTVFDIPSQDKVSFDSTDIVFSANPSDSSSAADIRVGNYSDYKASAVTKENIAMGGTSLIISNIDNISGDQTADNVIISSSYNTGWMPGDIKLATLSDTKIEKVGVDESTDLVTNSGFDNETNGWSIGGAGASYEVNPDEQLVVTRGGSSATASQTIPTVIGKTYVLSCDLIAATGGAKLILDLGSSSSIKSDEIRVHTVTHVATSTSTVIEINVLDASTGTITVDNISVKQTGELISNGTFDDGTEGWTAGTGWSISAGVATHDASSNAGDLDQSLDLIVGKSYTIIVEITSSDATEFYFKTDDGDYVAIEGSPVGTHAYTFIADKESQNVGVRGSVNWGGSIDNISVRLAEDDRSVNNNGLQVFGEIDKTPVATGADLVAYSGFSADDYLMQPYNSDLDFGTGDFCVMLWLKFTKNDAYDGIISKANSWLIDTGLNNSIAFKVWNGGTDYLDTVSADGDSVYGAWRCLCVKRESDVLSLFLDGVEKTDPNNPHSNSTDFTSEFGLLVGSGPSSPANDTLISLVRVSKTAPTDAQIAKIYRDEKVLFTDGAQATLYGTSDAVTALAYDDKTELLHVGTSDGRSDFAGLRRINNTTIPVTTSISASNNLIAEQ